jgi:hypothetical protein
MIRLIFTVLVGASSISALPAVIELRTVACTLATVTVTVTAPATKVTAPTITTVNLAATTVPASNTVISVSRAGGVLNPSAAAEANPFDPTATRAFTNVTIQSSAGLCLFIDETAGDFREELIPITLKPCDGSLSQKFDFITAGKHINVANSTLIVSSLMNGCLNFDPRRAAGDTVIMFSCGGRADGGGGVTNSQLFTFAWQKSLKLQPENGNGVVCLAPNAAGRLDQAVCGSDSAQEFTIV